MNSASSRRLEELLATRAIQGLDVEEKRELDALLEHHPEWDDEGFERAAAALDLALQPELLEVPPALLRRLGDRARTWTSSGAEE